MPVYEIQHITRYEYDAPVIDSTNMIRMHPFHSPDQQVLKHEVNITGDPSLFIYADHWGNRTGVFTLTEPHYELTIDSRLVVDVHEHYIEDTTPLTEMMRLDYSRPDDLDHTERIMGILSQCPYTNDSHAIAAWCNHHVFEHFTYEKGITTIETTVDDILRHGKGVCQDFAHVLLQLLRTAGIPARYVSGYICPNKNGMRGEGATHAWVEVWLEGKGWKGLDPTNDVWVSMNHIRLAVGRDFNDCSPAKGTFKGMANQRLHVYVSVGYEDGHVFEEHTQVKMNEERVIIPAIIPKHFYSQQQQQQ